VVPLTEEDRENILFVGEGVVEGEGEREGEREGVPL